MSAVLSDTRLNQRAEEIMLADVEAYSDWIREACSYCKPIEIVVWSWKDIAIQELIDSADVPKLVAMTLYPKKDVAWAAQWELRNRYLSDERLFKLAQEKAAEES